MTRDDIIRMAREAGFDAHDMSDDFTCNLIDIERFANLVAASEREACAKVCEDYAKQIAIALNESPILHCAAAIRERGKK